MAKVILVLGHGPTKSQDPGATGNGTGELVWNEDFLLNYLIPMLKANNIDSVMVRRTRVRVMPYKEVNAVAKSGDICISFHLNSYDAPSANGMEVLFYGTSKNSRRLATALANNISEEMGSVKRWGKDEKGNSVRNGTVPITSSKQRGYPLLRHTVTPCALIEPFFVSNPDEVMKFTKRKEDYAKAVMKSIKEYFNI